MHSIFQISISRNTICTEIVDFCKDGHILGMTKILQFHGITGILPNTSIEL